MKLQTMLIPKIKPPKMMMMMMMMMAGFGKGKRKVSRRMILKSLFHRRIGFVIMLEFVSYFLPVCSENLMVSFHPGGSREGHPGYTCRLGWFTVHLPSLSLERHSSLRYFSQDHLNFLWIYFLGVEYAVKSPSGSGHLRNPGFQ